MELKRSDMLRLIITLALVSVVAVTGGCGDDDDDEFDGTTVVTGVAIDNSVLIHPESTVARVEFSFSSDDVFDDDQNVLLAVQLPSIVRYHEGSAELQRAIDDHQIDPLVESCGDGSSFLIFNFDEGDLIDADNPGGNADAELTLTIDSFARGTSSITAAGGLDTIFRSCDSAFPAQGIAAFTVQ